MFISLVLAVIAISSTTASLNDIGSDFNAANLWDEDLRAVAADKVIELTPSTLPRSHFPSSMQGWFDPSENEQGINHAMRRLQLTGYEGPEGLMPPTFVTTYWGKEMVDKIKTYFTHDATVAQEERNGTMIRGGMRMKCRHTRGRWCGRYESQPDLPFKSPPRGSKQCPDNCNNVGNCNHDLGICYCTAGWKGDDCKVPEKRPCSNGDRAPGSLEPQSHIDKDGNDLNWLESGWRASRCAGVCDDDVAMCYCGGKNEKLRRINAPLGSLPGTPPINRGRPLSEWCGKVKETPEGKKV